MLRVHMASPAQGHPRFPPSLPALWALVQKGAPKKARQPAQDSGGSRRPLCLPHVHVTRQLCDHGQLAALQSLESGDIRVVWVRTGLGTCSPTFCGSNEPAGPFAPPECRVPSWNQPILPEVTVMLSGSARTNWAPVSKERNRITTSANGRLVTLRQPVQGKWAASNARATVVGMYEYRRRIVLRNDIHQTRTSLSARFEC